MNKKKFIGYKIQLFFCWVSGNTKVEPPLPKYLSMTLPSVAQSQADNSTL